jgi:MerR family transcriptional regulator/heat shock protein HspR
METVGSMEPGIGTGYQQNLPLPMIKIGAVAREFNISVDLLRLYEREGLIIPLKSAAGTRYYTQQDYPWIATVLRLVREARLNFAGIRHLLALLPCWELRKCGYTRRQCPVASNRHAAQPCWMQQKVCGCKLECYFCRVYRAAPSCENLKGLLLAAESRMHALASGVVTSV